VQFHKKASASGGLRPQTPHWGTATGGLPSPRRSDPQSSFMSPNNPVRSTPLGRTNHEVMYIEDQIKIIEQQQTAEGSEGTSCYERPTDH